MDNHLPEYELYAIRYAERDARRDRDPHEVVHRHRPVMRIAADERAGTPCIRVVRVMHGVDLPFRHTVFGQ